MRNFLLTLGSIELLWNILVLILTIHFDFTPGKGDEFAFFCFLLLLIPAVYLAYKNQSLASIPFLILPTISLIFWIELGLKSLFFD